MEKERFNQNIHSKRSFFITMKTGKFYFKWINHIQIGVAHLKFLPTERKMSQD